MHANFGGFFFEWGLSVEYSKPALTYEDQARLLIERGVEASVDEIIEKLSFVNYYRFSSYLYPFKNKNSEQFIKGTMFSTVWDLYKFDRDLRSLVFKAIEIVEIAIRTKITYHFSHSYGPFGYTQLEYFPFFEQDEFELWKKEIHEEIIVKKDYAITHFYDKYGEDHELPPLWIACEFMPFGKIVTLYRKLDKNLKDLISKDFDIPHKVFRSWILSLNYIRNVCAHHGRLWNIVVSIKPELPKEKKGKYKEWEAPIKIENHKVFGILTILNFLTKQVDEGYQLKNQLILLFKNYPQVPIASMGFPANWNDSSLWR